MSNNQKDCFRHVKSVEHDEIDKQIKIVDELILSKRTGSRVYAGLPVKSKTKEEDNVVRKKTGFCPAFW